MYKEKYVLREALDWEKRGRTWKRFCVSHFEPIDGGTSLVFTGIKYFETLEDAMAYKQEQEERLLSQGKGA